MQNTMWEERNTAADDLLCWLEGETTSEQVWDEQTVPLKLGTPHGLYLSALTNLLIWEIKTDLQKDQNRLGFLKFIFQQHLSFYFAP